MPNQPCPRYLAFNTSATPSSVRATAERLRSRTLLRLLHRTTSLEDLAGGSEAVDSARANIRDHLAAKQPWSVEDAANLSRFIITSVRADEAPERPVLTLFLLFNRHAQRRGMPAMAYSTFVTALHQVAAATPLITLEGGDKVLIAAPYETLHAPREKGVAPAELRAQYDRITKAGLDKVPVDSADNVAVVIKFIECVLHAAEDGVLTGDAAYEAYTAWGSVFSAKPMHRGTFRTLLKALICELAPNITVIPANDGETYKGLHL